MKKGPTEQGPEPQRLSQVPVWIATHGPRRRSLARLGVLADPDLDTFLALRRTSKSGHDGSMEQVGGENASPNGASANRRSADAYALALLPTIRTLMAAGFVSQRELAAELNRRGIATARGGNWHRTTVVRMLRRVALPIKRAPDMRAEALRLTIYKLRKAGFVSISAIARELNKRGIPTPQGGKWHMTMVTRLLERLDRLDRISRSQRGR
jgi:hypothetical protein